MESFEECLEGLAEFDIYSVRVSEHVGTGPARQRVELNLFDGVDLPLTYEEWADIYQRDGDFHVGGCCSTMSQVQDTMDEAFKNDGYISCHDLDTVIETLRLHDADSGEEGRVPYDRTVPLADILGAAHESWDTYTPWDKVLVTWHIIKDHFTVKQPVGFGPHVAPLDQAMNVVAQSLRYLSISRFFHETQQDHATPTAELQRQASDMLATARLLPALKSLNERIHELTLPLMEGVTIVDLEDPEQPLHNGFGHCFYLDLAEVQRMAETWRRSNEAYQDDVCRPKLRRLGMRRVRISVEKGLEFLDDGPTPIPV